MAVITTSTGSSSTVLGKRARSVDADDSIAATPTGAKLSRRAGKGRKKRARSRKHRHPLTDLGSTAVLQGRDTSSRDNGSPIHKRQQGTESELSSLRDELLNKSKTLTAKEDILEQITNALSCEICLNMLVRPHAVVPCGHVACYSCLVTWFKQPPRDDDAVEFPDEIPSILLKQKTCPRCRTVLISRPVEVFTLKSLSEILSGPNLPESSSATLETPSDLWEDIFPPLRSTLDPHVSVIFDNEDGGVPRCSDCLHEIWDGVCTGCDRHFAIPFLGGNSDDDDDFPGTSNNPGRDMIVSGYNPHSPITVDSDGDSDSYESSFIDDTASPDDRNNHGSDDSQSDGSSFPIQGDGRDSVVATRLRHNARPLGFSDAQTASSSHNSQRGVHSDDDSGRDSGGDDENSEDDVIQDSQLFRVVRRGRVVSSDDDEL